MGIEAAEGADTVTLSIHHPLEAGAAREEPILCLIIADPTQHAWLDRHVRPARLIPVNDLRKCWKLNLTPRLFAPEWLHITLFVHCYLES